MYRLPALSTATPTGLLRLALVAGPPSPENPCVPLPATTVRIPAAVTFTTVPFDATYRFPDPSIATDPYGAIGAVVATSVAPGPPPANVVIICAPTGTVVTET